jgi:hypothetical protein
MVALQLAACGRVAFDPRSDAATDVTSDDACAKDAGCDPLRIEVVGCFDGPTSGDQLCQRTGWAGASVANGYYWFQCTGFAGHECPGGFDANLMCTTWCGNVDCQGWEYCASPTGDVIHEVLGDGASVFDPEAYGRMCGAFNPGWIVALRCHD